VVSLSIWSDPTLLHLLGFFYCTCWLAFLIGQVGQVGQLGGSRGKLGHG
jgi:hypothetical protein